MDDVNDTLVLDGPESSSCGAVSVSLTKGVDFEGRGESNGPVSLAIVGGLFSVLCLALCQNLEVFQLGFMPWQGAFINPFKG